MFKKTILLLILVLFSFFIYPEEVPIDFSPKIDWQDGKLEMNLTIALALQSKPFGTARFEAEQKIADVLAHYFWSSISDLAMDSRTTLAEFFKQPDYAAEAQQYFSTIAHIAKNARKKISIVSSDFKRLSVSYEIPFWGKNGFAAPLIYHQQVLPLERKIGYYPSKPFSGLLIYARGLYPAFGKNMQTKIKPALFPKIYYLTRERTIECLLDKQRLNPAALSKWGMLSYQTTLDSKQARWRVGDFPLEISVQMLYGIYNTDIIISEQAALQLLTNKANHEILQEGKIVVLIDPN